MATVIESQQQPAVETRLSLVEYVELEQSTGERHEFHDGRVVPMVGGSEPHFVIAGNVFAELRTLLKGTNNRVYPAEMRVHVPAANRYIYPDACACAAEPQFGPPKDTLLNPTLAVEVLSPSTEGYDRGEKFAQYRTIDTFKEYLLVCQDRHHVEQFVKQDDGNWLLKDCIGEKAVITMESLGCELALTDIYAQVDFSKAERTPPPAKS